MPYWGNAVLTTKQHADILSDLAAALAGSIGIAPTSNLDPTRQNPSMFEPIHGSAFDIHKVDECVQICEERAKIDELTVQALEAGEEMGATLARLRK